jgi:hypothetical protein
MSFEEMKARAREMMSAQMGNLIIVFLIYVLILSGLSSFSIGRAWLVVYGPLSVGIAAILLKLDRGETFTVEELFPASTILTVLWWRVCWCRCTPSCGVCY